MSTATSANRSASADPLYQQPFGDRPVYATGMLLDAQDFQDEQTYHRGQLARALLYLAGGGTLAGLRVAHQAAIRPGEEPPGETARPEEVRVAAGLAVDRVGRLIELPRTACLRLERWWDAEAARDGGDGLRRAAQTELLPLLSPRARAEAQAPGAAPLPARAVVADVYLRFVACPRGLTPAFAAGPFDALNAVSVSRLRDAHELLLVARPNLRASDPGLPLAPGAVGVAGESEADALAREAAVGDTSAPARDAHNAALQDAVLHGYRRSADGTPQRGPEHTLEMDASALFIARLLIPVDAADPTTRDGAAVRVDNYARHFLPSAGLLARWGGL